MTNTSIAPPVPAGTRAALATTFPVKEFSVETKDAAAPWATESGSERPGGTTVTFSE